MITPNDNSGALLVYRAVEICLLVLINSVIEMVFVLAFFFYEWQSEGDTVLGMPGETDFKYDQAK
jgi:hypothetical protein